MRRASSIGFALAVLLVPSFLSGQETEVRFRLPQRAKVDLDGRDSIFVAPFVVLSQEGEGRLGGSLDVQKEFARYIDKVLRRETELAVVDSGPLDYPTFDLTQLARSEAFWKAVGERTQADLIFAGGLDFDLQDRSGYRTEEYPSPIDGRTMVRQVLVEQTGFEYDIAVMVLDGRTGKLLATDNFKDFKSFEGAQANPLQGMFENLYALQDRLLGLFVAKEIEASRVLFAGR